MGYLVRKQEERGKGCNLASILYWSCEMSNINLLTEDIYMFDMEYVLTLTYNLYKLVISLVG